MLERLGDRLWCPWLLGLFLLVGGIYSLGSGWFQIWGLRDWLLVPWKGLRRKGETGRGLTQRQALSTALASTIGTGSIAGVATAIFYGGPGAVFWMWVSAFLGMMTSFAEKLLAVQYRERGRNGWQGGPMCYIRRGLGVNWLAAAFSFACVGSSLCGGNMVQANSIAYALEDAAGISRAATGVVLMAVVGVIMLGGIDRIGQVSEGLVPLMALLYLGSGVLVVAGHWDAIPAAFGMIVKEAFQPRAVLGGGMGYGIGKAMRYGIARGVFTNEAGMGSSAMAHAAADVGEPAEEGLWGIFEVFTATILICSITAMAILTSGVYAPQSALDAMRRGTVSGSMVGAPLTAAAFASVLGKAGTWIISLSLVLFAFTSILGWSYYGQRGLDDLAGGGRGQRLYCVLFLGCILLGSIGEVGTIWQLADLLNGLMALPNLIALILLAPPALNALKRWEREKRLRSSR